MKPLMFFLVVAGLANAQPVGQSCCVLTATPTDKSPTTIRITVTNSGDQSVYVVLRSPWASYAITAKGVDGREPARTPLGDDLHSGEPVFTVSSSGKLLQKYESVDDVLDLSLLWTFVEGEYTINLSRVVFIEGHPVSLTTATVITVPPGFSSDDACTVEVQERNERTRSKGPLRGEEGPGQSDEFERALLKKIDLVAGPASHHFVYAFKEALRGAHLAGGMTLWNHGPLGPVCLVKGESVRDALEKIQAARAELIVDGRSPVVNVLDTRVSDFLETRIGKLHMPSPNYGPDDAISALLDAPEVKARMEFLTVEEAGPQRMPLTGRNKERAEADRPIDLENTTVRQALNAIVQRVGDGIWVYNEAAVGAGHRVFRIDLTLHSTNLHN